MHNPKPTRRQFVKSLAAGTLLAGLSGVSRAQGGKRPPNGGKRPPNIVIVLTDDQGFGDVHAHGNERIDTPVQDGLRASGARFTHFYVSPVCAPTRAGLLTGRYPHRSGVSGVTRGLETMRSEEVTLGEVFQGAGYVTGCFGKWHNGAHYPNHPNGQGFDEFFGFCCGHWNNYFDTRLERNGRPVETKGYITDVLTDEALAFIEKNKAKPFLCYIPYNAPHAPFQVPDRYFDKYTKRGFDEPLASVYGMIENIDDNVGRILAKLDSLGLTEDTIVAFFGDNGANWDRYNAGLRGRKGSVHEGGVKSPLFIKWQGHIKPGSVIEPVSAHIDLLPTFAALAGVDMPKTKPLDGMSLAPLILGEPQELPERMIFTHWGNRGAVRTQQYRWVKEKGKPQLYDMAVDPGEEHDIAAEKPEVTAQLGAAFEAWLKDVTQDGLAPPPIAIGYDEMPEVELPAHEGQLEGGVEYQGGKGWANDWVTNWTSLDGTVTWPVQVVKAGVYAVTLMYVCPEADVGAEVCVEVAGKRLAGKIAKAHDPEPVASPDRYPRWEVYEKVWAPLALGEVELPVGEGGLVVKALSKPGERVMDLKAVRVRRVSPA